jgi:acyl-CoA synthetase (NDP forming)
LSAADAGVGRLAVSAPKPDLRRLFSPKSIALVGVSRKAGTSRGLLRALDEYRFPGDLFLVNPAGGDIDGRPIHRAVSELPSVPELALVVVPADHVASVVAECGQCGIPAGIVYSAGFADDRTAAGHHRNDQLADAVATTGIRLIGPNCLGFYNVRDRIAATWSSSVQLPGVVAHFRGAGTDPDADDLDLVRRAQGSVGIVAQSGGLGFSLFNRGLGLGIGFSYIISAGNEVDLEVQDFVEFLFDDPDTRVILLYVEGFKDPSRLQGLAARAEALGKSIVIAKVGRSRAAARAALSHTGHLAGDDAAFDALFDRYGIVRVDDAEEMLDVALALSTCPKPASNRAAIVSYSGGNAVWMADACDSHGIEIPPLGDAARAALEEVLPTFAATSNPVDISGGSKTTPALALTLVAEDPQIDSLVLIASYNRAQAVNNDQPYLEALRAKGTKPVLLYSYTDPVAEAKALLREMNVVSFSSTERCARVLGALVQAGTHRIEPPPEPLTTAPALRARAEAWSSAGASVPEYEVKRLLAVAAAEAIGFPVALKIQSPDVGHKARYGGIALGVADAGAVKRAYADIVDAVALALPDAAIDGVLVQEMVPPGSELMVGVQNSSGLGPMVMLGVGGSLVEVIGRTVLYPAPFGPETAEGLLRRINVDKLLAARGVADPDAHLECVAGLVSTISLVAFEVQDAVVEMDLNPVMIDDRTGVATVVDALAVTP